MTSPSLQDRLQAVVGDSYRIEREISGGGMSRLFLATEASLERKVVIKLLPPEFASDVSAARFQREIFVAAQLQHPHILPVLSSGVREGLFYYIMPYVAGESLQRRLEREGKLPITDAICILREVADALACAHRAGIVHRDVKPANILLLEDHAVLTDFGIARAVAEARAGATGNQRLTETGFSVGTVGYMAPEQLVGERELDARADVYALGVVGYEMFAGRPPFSGPTAQAMLVAHLTEPPKPLTEVRSDVPVPVSDAITKALGKTPDERFATAGQFRVAIELATTTSFPVPHSRPGKRRLAIGAGVIAVVAGAAAVVAHTASRPDLNPNLLAVAPFDLRDISDTTWRQNLMDLLSKKLDGAGNLRTVPGSVVIRGWGGRADAGTARQLGRNTGAGLVIFGNMIAVGEDSIAMTASILDVATNRILGGTEVERRGLRNEINNIAMDLAVGILTELGKTRAVGAFRQTSLESTSLPALKAFLIGEQYYRLSAWDSAIAYYERAIALDSTLTLALGHAGRARAWQYGSNDSLAGVYLLRAGALNRNLSKRDSLLVAADSVRYALRAFETDTAYLASVRRMFAMLEEAKNFYPEDPEVWFALADAHYHYGAGPGVGMSERSLLDAFDHAIRLDSGFAPTYIHPVELAFRLRRRAAGLQYADAYLALNPTDADAEGVRVTHAIIEEGRVSSAAKRLLDTASLDALFGAWMTVRRWPDSAETALVLARLPPTGRQSSGAWFTTPEWRRRFLAQELAYRGHLREAFETIGGADVAVRDARLVTELALLNGVPPGVAGQAVARWLREGNPSVFATLPWLAARGDTTSVLIAKRRADSLTRAASTPVQRRDARYRQAAVDAYLQLARRDTTGALRLFTMLPDTACLICFRDRLTRAQLLAARGQLREAERILDERLYILLSPSEVVFALERARVAERLGKKDKAADAYAFVADAWANADPELRPLVAEANAALGRPGGHQSAGKSIALAHP